MIFEDISNKKEKEKPSGISKGKKLYFSIIE